jgi:ubiquinone/menaquinone biosynthesis C-methylase UbiE
MIKGTKFNIAEVYDRIAEVAGNEFASTAQMGLGEVESFFKGLSKGSHILDTGPGKGIEAKLAMDYGHSVVGLDISPKMLDLFMANNPSATSVLGSVVAIPESCQNFDAVHSSCCILHLDKESAQKAIREFKRVLKKNGKLFLVTTISNGEEEININEGLKNMGVESWFFYHWESSDLRSNLEAIGFHIEYWIEKSLIPGRPNLAIIVAQSI